MIRETSEEKRGKRGRRCINREGRACAEEANGEDVNREGERNGEEGDKRGERSGRRRD